MGMSLANEKRTYTLGFWRVSKQEFNKGVNKGHTARMKSLPILSALYKYPDIFIYPISYRHPKTDPYTPHGDRTRECVSCDLNTIYADRCNWVDPTFSPEGSYVVINCGGTGNGVPVSTLHYISDSGDISLRGEVENNTQLIENLEAFKFRTREYGEISLPQVDDEVFYYTLHKPPNFDPSKKYPLLVQVYSGPGYQDTIDSFISTWAIGYIPSSDLDVVVVTFDGRGTGFRGDKIRNMVYNRLGEYEPLDQIEATRQITEKYNFIDSSKVAMWGRSYGGYITARTMSEDENILFRCGLSVAPVTDWMTYHNFYTERYMGLPKENGIGYNKSTVFQKLHNIGKHYFVLIHGTSDENVHFLHSARLSKALIDEDIDFSAYFAGDEPHRFDRGANAYGHHYKLLTHHLKSCFEL
uniref:dipeptidyl peptidase 4-like n=1 Tax=Styela clava TaxID=7725 RepID=UPI001939E0E3|nr:dipeptidyl peptidase 4-like [Styela clava]